MKRKRRVWIVVRVMISDRPVLVRRSFKGGPIGFRKVLATEVTSIGLREVFHRLAVVAPPTPYGAFNADLLNGCGPARIAWPVSA